MTLALDIIVEDLQGSLWVAAIHKTKIEALEIDPYAELVRWGSIYWARVDRIDSGLNAAFLDLGHGVRGFLPASEIPGGTKDSKIGRRLRTGQFVMVQVKTAQQPPIDPATEEAMPDDSKASRVSMDVALQGRFLIYTPLSPGNRVSRRIKDADMRKSMLSMIKKVDEVQNCILRASAGFAQTDMLIREARIQRAIWESLQEFKSEKEPALLMLGPDALQRVLADFANARIGKIEVADDERFEEAHNWCDLYAPELMSRLEQRVIQNTRNGMGLMEAHDILGQIEGLLKPVMLTPSGGTVVMEDTQLGTMIDVNTGIGAQDKVNHEAAVEIARQIRLRNIGGTILIDFAGFLDKAAQKRMVNALTKAFNDDPCTVELHGVTKLGLFEVSRQRRTSSLLERIELMQAEE